ncbi:hypothetical protein [Arachnia propionica]|uniref:hypothetical protein n=1 Tax=Arachnia propionica TaxID=1750 RepID=UPI0016397E4A|nr:hypothetical protein [Arachnia propionica]
MTRPTPIWKESLADRDQLPAPDITEAQQAAVWRLLARHDANDLADMLGLTEEATS